MHPLCVHAAFRALSVPFVIFVLADVFGATGKSEGAKTVI